MLFELLRDAAAGRFPPADGGWHRELPWRPDVEAVVAFTGHAVLVVGHDVDDATLASLHPDGVGGAHHPDVVAALADGGDIDCLDALLVAPGVGGPKALPWRTDLDEHPRVRHARQWRREVRVAGDERGFVTVGLGVGDLAEVSVEVVAGRRGAGDGRALAAAALTVVPPEEPLLAAVAPGNAASLRAFLAAGFVPIGSVQLYRPRRES